jgi:hypothetical protein
MDQSARPCCGRIPIRLSDLRPLPGLLDSCADLTSFDICGIVFARKTKCVLAVIDETASDCGDWAVFFVPLTLLRLQIIQV